METNNLSLTMTFEPELAAELHELAKLEEMPVEEMVSELILESLEWRAAIAQAAEECGDDADFATILSKVLQNDEADCGDETECA